VRCQRDEQQAHKDALGEVKGILLPGQIKDEMAEGREGGIECPKLRLRRVVVPGRRVDECQPADQRTGRPVPPAQAAAHQHEEDGDGDDEEDQQEPGISHALL